MTENSIHPTDESETQLVDRLRALAGVTQPSPAFVARLEADLCARQRLISTEGMSNRTTHPINLQRQTTLKRLGFALTAVAAALALALGLPALFGDNRDLPPLPRLVHAADVGVPPEPAGLLVGADLALATDLPHAPAEVPVYRSTIALPPATPEEALARARDFGLSNPQVYRDPREPAAIFVLGDDDRKLIFRPFGPMGGIHYGDDAVAAAAKGTPLPFDQAAEFALAFLREHDLLPSAYRVEEPLDYEPSAERPIRMVRVVPELDERPLVGYNTGLHVAVNPAGQVTYASFSALHTERGGEYPIKSAQEAYDELTGREVAGSPFRLDTDIRNPAAVAVKRYYPDPPTYAAGDPVTATGWVHVLVAEQSSDVRAQLTARDGTQYDLTGPRVAELASVGYDDVEVRGRIVSRVGPGRWQLEVSDWETAPQRQPQCLVGTFTLAGEESWLATEEGERYRLSHTPDELADGARIEVCANEEPVEGEELDWWTIVSPPTPEQGYVGSSSSTVSVVVEEAVEVPPDAPPPPPPPTPTPLPRTHIVQEGETPEIGQSVEVTGVVHATVFVNEGSRRIEASLQVDASGERFPLSGPPDMLEAIAQLDRLHVRVHGQVIASPQEGWPSGTQTIEIENLEKIWPDERAQGFLGHLDLETLEGCEVAVLTDHETGQRYVMASSLEADGGGWPLTGDPILNYKQIFVAGVVQPGETYAGMPVLQAARMHQDSQTDAATSADEIPLDIPQVIDESRFPFGPQGRVEGTFFVDRVELAYYYEPQSPAPTVSPDEAPTWPQPAEQILQPVWVFYGHNADDTTRFVAYVQAVTEEHIENAVATVAPTSPPPGTPTPATRPSARTPTPVAETVQSEPDRIRRIPAPDGRWTAVVNETAGSLDLQNAEGETLPIFPEGSTVGTANWSPDGQHLLVVRTNWLRSESGEKLDVSGPAGIWHLRVEGDRVGEPRPSFRPPPELEERAHGTIVPSQIVLGQWSPDCRHVLLWLGPLSASILADGLPLRVLDVETGQITLLADAALLNPKYQSWATDGSALAFTAGGYRSAQVNKWLNLFDVTSGQVTTVVSMTDQVPGIVAWSPRGDLIAYAAVPAAETGPGMADWMVFENPAIAGRRVYLLDPATGQHWRLNDTDAFQDAPTWSDDGEILYYVEREEDTMALMAADPATGQAWVVEGSRQPAPGAVGYYGQPDWDDLLAHRQPETARAAVPPLTETYVHPAYGYTLRYPSSWHAGKGWQGLLGRQEMPTLTSYPPDAAPPDLGVFSGQAIIAIQVVQVPAGDLETLLDQVLASPGPGQVPIPDEERALTAFDRRERTVDGRPAARLEAMGEFGTVNHVLVVLDGIQGFILRGQGDGRLFDTVAESLRLP